MTKEDRQLLLKDLATRLPYGLYATVRDPEENDDFQPFEVLGIKEDLVWVRNTMIGVDHFDTIEVVKPYLRPMSSMMKEEKHELLKFGVVNLDKYNNAIDVCCVGFENHAKAQDYLNSIHVDYRGMIEKGLAIEAPEGMY